MTIHKLLFRFKIIHYLDNYGISTALDSQRLYVPEHV